MRDKTKNGRFVHRFLDDVRRLQAAAITFVDQAVVEGRTFRPRKPYKWRIDEVGDFGEAERSFRREAERHSWRAVGNRPQQLDRADDRRRVC